ncbi:hypothetical protein GDO78_021709, partial [Eleutherodactylus coqui]
FTVLMVFILEGVVAQITLEVSGPGTVKPTETLEMTLGQWVRQPAGKGLEWLGGICHNNAIAYAESLQGRLTLTRDTNKGEVYAKLTAAKAEESGKYYAARESHS